MKQAGNKQWQSKTQSLLAILIYRLAQGPVETEPFATSLQQVFIDRITANPVNTDVLKDSLAQVQLDKLPKPKRLKRKFAHFLKLQKQNGGNREQSSDHPPSTIGQIVSGWAELTGQDETEFTSVVSPKITRLVTKHYKASRQVGLTDNQAGR